MKRDDERLLAREASGEATPAERAEIDRRAAADAEFARLRDARRRLWASLELPPPGAPPPGFAARVAARAREEARREAPAFARRPAVASAAAALLVAGGVAAGVALAALAPPAAAADELGLDDAAGSLADDFLAASERTSDLEAAP